jgi:hypothetical protein
MNTFQIAKHEMIHRYTGNRFKLISPSAPGQESTFFATIIYYSVSKIADHFKFFRENLFNDCIEWFGCFTSIDRGIKSKTTYLYRIVRIEIDTVLYVSTTQIFFHDNFFPGHIRYSGFVIKQPRKDKRKTALPPHEGDRAVWPKQEPRQTKDVAVLRERERERERERVCVARIAPGR